MDNKNTSILTFDTDKTLYALITCKNKIWRIGNKIVMSELKEHYNTSQLEIFEKYKPFDIVKIDVEQSFVKKAEH